MKQQQHTVSLEGMENYKTFVGGRIGLISFTLGMFLVFQSAHAFNQTDPTHNVNLSPFERWKSAYYCMYNTVPVHCSPKGQLTFSGIVDVAPSEKEDYCSDTTGCSKHALDVLKCIHLVKRDFWFHNNATVAILNQTIIEGCSNKNNNSGISTANYKSSGMKVYQKMYIPFVASLSSLAFIAMSNIM